MGTLPGKGTGPMPQRRRHNPNISALARQKIQAAHLVRLLQRNAKGKIKPELSLSRIRSIEILLRKIVPDLTQASVTAEVTHKYVVEVPPLLTRDEWSKKYRAPQQQLPQKAPPPTLDLEPLPTLPLLTNNTKQ